MSGTLDWKTALFFMTKQKGWQRQLFRGGAYIAIFPPIGWALALGYRSIVGSRLVEGTSPLLPEWSGNHYSIFQRGCGAIGVIISYFLPFYLFYWYLGIGEGVDYWFVAAFFILSVIYPPLFLPTLPILYPIVFHWVNFQPAEIAFLVVLFFGTTFFLPSAFVQVALRGTYLAAFRIRDVFSFVLHNLTTYIEAWLISFVVSAFAVLSGILLPWGLFWSYLVILYVFNEALVKTQSSEVLERYKNSILLSDR